MEPYHMILFVVLSLFSVVVLGSAEIRNETLPLACDGNLTVGSSVVSMFDKVGKIKCCVKCVESDECEVAEWTTQNTCTLYQTFSCQTQQQDAGKTSYQKRKVSFMLCYHMLHVLISIASAIYSWD